MTAGGVAIVGSDWPNPLPVTTYGKPKAKPTGLDWSKHTTPEPVVTEPVDVPEPVMVATKVQAYAQDTAAHDEALQRVEQLEARPVTPDTAPDRTVPEIETPQVIAVTEAAKSGTHPVVRLLDLTAHDLRPEVVSARDLVANALQLLRLVATAPPA